MGKLPAEMACAVYTVRNYKISNALPSLLTQLVRRGCMNEVHI